MPKKSCRNCAIGEVQKDVNLVDVVKSFVRKSEKQKMEMKKENKYDTTRTVRNFAGNSFRIFTTNI